MASVKEGVLLPISLKVLMTGPDPYYRPII